MCLAVPAIVKSRQEFNADVEMMGNKLTVGIMLTPEVKVGQYVLVHAGQAVQIIDEEAALISLQEWEKLLNE
ncbi:HypC/HybG/HupF family hydrogenase formation chaperone [Brevibacillus ginsengisoli]|uniref:HypC/HybG/HupF family hydrogenase formation chaperone n=1 Tax=Brevibacillus ginsengisoli TaxID=363854 RepID=UPI003CF6C83E